MRSTAPDYEASCDTKYVTGIVTLDQRMIVLIDVDWLVTSIAMKLIGG